MAGNPFVQEINFQEIELLGVVGKGSYGTVRKGKWRDIDVAVKIIETEQEKKSFIVEVQQLSRVDHVNIVKLYGACTKTPVCLVMEYAEGGSLYNVLHCMKQVQYTAAHALSWLLQTANGVAYLHNMKPGPLIHRDLKPPNLLLVNGGTVLKICDFGTACDKHTNMTNSKGSAAWMAPEVFEGSEYSEKCDVFSWGIILWEVLTREKPFSDGEGATAFRIMWAVHNGKRPPLIQGCPRVLENLMTRCWSKNAKVRPSMTTVRDELSHILKYMKGADQPLIFSPQQETNITVETSSPITTVDPASQKNATASSGSKTFLPNKNSEDFSPTDMFLSVDPVGEKYAKDMKKRRSADFSNSDFKIPQNSGHRRTGSYDSPLVKTPDAKPSESYVEDVNKFSEMPEPLYNDSSKNFMPESSKEAGNHYIYSLEPRLQPLPPVHCPESIEIYEKHLNLARELFRYRNEIKLLTDRKKELLEQLHARDKSSTYIDEYIHLKKEKEGLLQLRTNLKRQLEIIRGKQKGDNSVKSNKDDWVVV